MSLPLYFDHNMPSPLAMGLRQRGIDVLTAREDGTSLWNDLDLWQRPIAANRIFVTQDRDFLLIATECQAEISPFPGLILCQMAGVPTHQLIEELALIAQAATPEEVRSTIRWVPL